MRRWRGGLTVAMPVAMPVAMAILTLAVTASGVLAQGGERGREKVAEKSILMTPPLQWETSMLGSRPIWHQSINDLALLTGGILFGMSPRDVNTTLPDPTPGLDWAKLPLATEFPEDVRYFWIRMHGSKAKLLRTENCTGHASYVTFLFRSRGLFRISFRFLADEDCPSTNAAATEIMARYVLMPREVVQSMHYRNGQVEVVDLVDPASGYLVGVRWLQRGR